MGYPPKPAVRIRLDSYSLWTAEINYDRLLESAPDRPVQTPVLMQWILDLDVNDLEKTFEGEYFQVTFTLGLPYNNPAQADIETIGDSLIGYGRTPGGFVSKNEIGEEFRVRIIPNGHDRMSRIVAFIPVSFGDAQDAEDIAYRAVRPVLSQISALYHVPLETLRVETFRYLPPSQVSYQLTVLYPFAPQQFQMSELQPFQDLVSYPAFLKAVNHFREGMNSWSPVHRFLSLFKAIEALQGLQNDLRKEHGPLRFQPSFVQDNYAIRFLFKDCIGKRHASIVDGVLRDPYRNAAAHWGKDDDLDLLSDYRAGLLQYHFLCVLAQDVFRGMLTSTAAYERVP